MISKNISCPTPKSKYTKSSNIINESTCMLICDVLLLYYLDCLLQPAGYTEFNIVCTTGFVNDVLYRTGTHERLQIFEAEFPYQWFIR